MKNKVKIVTRFISSFMMLFGCFTFFIFRIWTGIFFIVISIVLNLLSRPWERFDRSQENENDQHARNL